VAIRSDELVRGVGRVGRDRQRALRFDCRRHELGDGRIGAPLEDVVVAAGADVDVDAEAALDAELLLLLLLPHAAMAATISSDSAPSADFLQITIRLLLV